MNDNWDSDYTDVTPTAETTTDISPSQTNPSTAESASSDATSPSNSTSAETISMPHYPSRNRHPPERLMFVDSEV